MWLRNCWYVIAWDHEIPAAGSPELFTRTVLGEPVLVIRRESGEFAALEDRCCHRLAPLSKGRREGDCVRCGYHGLKFDAQGLCVDAPGIPIIPEKARVRTYPIVNKNRWVFVWMGDPAKADPALLPDNFSCDHPDWKHKPGYLHYDTPYLLICDNLLDFSHLSYVHEKTLGGSTAIAQAKAETERVDGPGMPGVKVTRRVPNVPVPPYYRKMRSFTEGALLDRWFIYEFLLPGTLLMNSGGRPVGDPPDDLSNAVRLHSCQTLTPETETSTHYFFEQSHPSNQGDDSLTEGIFQSIVTAFEEDRDMITAQHRNILRDPAKAMVPLPIDGALVQFRRILSQKVAAESGQAASAS
ncbi:aromatic ring-hydroxylating dioxygenase subunit alpha [Ramlibacter henchirensis]|uniref:Aromatic ring-hydroxylating dioxygenase subunit alpha n=1 Tax=Ramlibacter henchirensis TaxID=204072 RepID=A0A4Z0BY95_9BURK|nr:aromatic ring-hydroxylating dioxygenase subunit alpha [Ramlibacter henchirensis]TFZ02995.1 aromatic ring-hydroxylating dioxygenase subunit alpha [Ramlibacter henchirensis]